MKLSTLFTISTVVFAVFGLTSLWSISPVARPLTLGVGHQVTPST